MLPTPIIPPLVTIVYDGVKLEQLSVAEATPMTTEQVLVVISAGIDRTGSSLSITVTSCIVELMLPAVSETVQVIVVTPTGYG